MPEEVLAVFKTAHEIDAGWHVRHQAVFQRHTDNGVSKTINLPADATEDDVARAYLLAWELQCLGITVFRDGSKGEQVLHRGVCAETSADSRAPAGGEGAVKPRPHSLTGPDLPDGDAIGTAFITVNDAADGEPFEVFVQVGKAGSDTMAVAEALGRLVSLILRLPSPLSPRRRVEEVASQLARIGGGQPTGYGPAKVLSLPDALSRTLLEHLARTSTGRESAPPSRAPRPRGSATSVASAARRPSSTRKAAEVPVVRLHRVLDPRSDAGPSARCAPGAGARPRRRPRAGWPSGGARAAGPVRLLGLVAGQCSEGA